VRNEGLFLGSSAAMNCVGAVKAARKLGPGHTVVTVLCDGGHRHLSKFHNPGYLEQWGLAPRAEGSGLEFIE
jgi:cysteine synthase A